MAMERQHPSFYKKPEDEIKQGVPERNPGRNFYDLVTDPELNMELLVKALKAGTIDDKEYTTLKDALMERLRYQ